MRDMYDCFTSETLS